MTGKTVKLKTCILLLLVPGFFLFGSLRSYALQRYNGYGGFSVGDTGIVSMGGAYLATSNDINAVMFNPAGIVFSEKKIDFGLTRQDVTNSQTDTNNDGVNDSFPLKYWYGGIIGKICKEDSTGKLAFGFVYSTPYEAVLDFEGNLDISGINTYIDLYLDIAVNMISFPFAYQIMPNTSVGINAKVFSVEEIFQINYSYLSLSRSYDYKQKVSGVSVDFGLMHRPNNDFSIGLVVKPGKKFDFDETMNDNLDNGAVQWFRDVELPLSLGLGLAYHVTENLKLACDSNYISGQDDSVLIGSGLITGFREYTLKKNYVVDFHFGADYRIPVSSWFGFNIRLGAYHEPSRVIGLDSRVHYTGGMEMRLSRLVFGVAMDKADDFENLSMTYSFVF